MAAHVHGVKCVLLWVLRGNVGDEVRVSTSSLSTTYATTTGPVSTSRGIAREEELGQLAPTEDVGVGSGAKCPKKTNCWTHLGYLLTLLKTCRRKVMEYTIASRPAQAPAIMWWVIAYVMSPAVDAINITFVMFKRRC
ncbi:hypothetical protein H257_10661 [Aphanomyces astaci]|uniref:Uncharacterized protein n=1 Tax=Aphanomyces astaci TaxID=112090 RepID=W4G5T9_APHAT|nr:hypothetical protein H257_10661 [Aphanomyces astaci]ETV75062.1 hypothetical protein H257_10661 [Aphanomyces astaci]|eukprot:XP_009835566.1 hypothetical protein H257_10661 [Aphanomyces astaci]